MRECAEKIKQNLQLIQEERQAIQSTIQESNLVVTSYHDNVERINKKAQDMIAQLTQ
jgi:hypothetical protein